MNFRILSSLLIVFSKAQSLLLLLKHDSVFGFFLSCFFIQDDSHRPGVLEWRHPVFFFFRKHLQPCLLNEHWTVSNTYFWLVKTPWLFILSKSDTRITHITGITHVISNQSACVSPLTDWNQNPSSLCHVQSSRDVKASVVLSDSVVTSNVKHNAKSTHK